MGKTPGKWIKALLSGKKSKSHSSKRKDSFKPSSTKDVLAVSSEAHVSDPIADSTVISQPTSGATASKGCLSEKGLVSELSNDRVILSARDEETSAQVVVGFGSQDDPEKIKLNQAAIKAQTAFRSYQARREFQTLKGVVQLQALIRGNLVRKQAVATLYCVKGIVKFQALVRGNKVRRSDIGLAVHKICKDTKCLIAVEASASTQTEKLSKSVFVNKLLASLSSVSPLCIDYNPEQRNLASDWLDRWTNSHFWAPLLGLESKTKLDSASSEKICNSHRNNDGQVKRIGWKSSGVKVNDGSVSDSSKNKQRPKKVSTHPSHSGQENAQKEVEKSNLRKPLKQNVSDRSETVNGKGKDLPRRESGHTVTDASEQGPNDSAGKIKESAMSKSKQSDYEQGLAQRAEDEHGSPISNLQSRLKNGKDDGIDSVSPKNYQRRASLPAKFDSQDDGVQKTPRLPSYMAPTESAKARVRGQGSPRLVSELVDKNGSTRRHSLSSSVNGKLGSISPLAESLGALSSKGVNRTDRSLSSSRDGSEKLIQPKWRR
ncbi:protein IQ-DOMAIN 29 [Prosopis cineraria]|uniref:protein IQ-DOMAIN 29 n=1 Tax=Prosopis cineraria TaxID=364024 RepID=UPI00240EFFF5|nr:protein IQ-DOMAIN 29 [Prosopis cineraria]XP_054808264.1 protein IQ-DOMAIN 29 [Prosopis cineraria]XP_054808265.1 protein IQ-DOMAIN 29 [Prosopis cineraria]XP_054808266.1 protein IQ-DOMAIN 29 [Prosopis cineraria]XP_054808267.1 protein IQ-DOMAIN 29 [Prosopis cineraria]XP_054808268.1 protein IQ-DOMAIN 29 [Prosopis cineraria]XP_054808269.1 protein IQ-DOMAIN 29 [Prosopis cineraria]